MGADKKTGRRAQPAVTTTLGVSGYLMESDVLLWDRASQSLWSQVDSRAIAGPRAGQTLTSIPVVNTTWSSWKKVHPKTKVLRGPRPAGRYGVAYKGYHASDKVMFPTSHRSDALANKAVVSGIRLGATPPCWDHAALKKAAAARGKEKSKQPLKWTTKVGDQQLSLVYDPVGDSLSATQRGEHGQQETLSVLRMYWFAWYTFHPRTELSSPPGAEPPLKPPK